MRMDRNRTIPSTPCGKATRSRPSSRSAGRPARRPTFGLQLSACADDGRPMAGHGHQRCRSRSGGWGFAVDDVRDTDVHRADLRLSANPRNPPGKETIAMSFTTSSLAGPLDQVTTWVGQWEPGRRSWAARSWGDAAAAAAGPADHRAVRAGRPVDRGAADARPGVARCAPRQAGGHHPAGQVRRGLAPDLVKRNFHAQRPNQSVAALALTHTPAPGRGDLLRRAGHRRAD